MKLPRKFGRYELVERVAVGGTAEIYRATLHSTDGFAKTVAVKTLLPQWVDNDELEHLLIDEAKVLCHLGHQSIVQVYELGKHDGVPFIAMEYVEGIDCARLLNRLIRTQMPLPVPLVLHIFENVLSALKLAHERVDANGVPIGIVHRDVSPSNILLSWTGEVKVTDFGIAKGSHRSRLTDAGQMRGKYAYMSPEQARGETLDRRSDLFSCGIVMYELLTARRLFVGQSDMDVIEAVEGLSLEAEDLSTIEPSLRSILLLALAVDREDRYRDAGEMIADIRVARSNSGDEDFDTDLSKYLNDLFSEEIEANRVESIVRSEPTRNTRVLDDEPHLSRRPGAFSKIRTYGWRVAMMVLVSFGFLSTHPADGSVNIERLRTTELPETAPSVGVPAIVPPEVKGIVAIDSDPPGAKGVLKLGDREMEIETPFTRSDIEVGSGVRGMFELNLAGHKPYVEEFELGPSSNAVVREVTLRKKVAARLYVGARPWGLASVSGYVSSRETPISGIAVKAGSHLVTVTHPPSGKRVSRRVTVSDGGVRKCLADFRGDGAMRCR